MNGYDGLSPHKSEYYPDSIKESKRVIKAMKNPDMEYFLLTDASPRHAFTQYLDHKKLSYDPEELKTIVQDSYPVIMAHKRYYNRPRPAQINNNILPQPSETAQTPAYPSGHAFQSYLLAKYLSTQHPFHRFAFYRIADRIARARLSVGLHYPSDNTQAFQLAHSL